jgi:hypothetical protein
MTRREEQIQWLEALIADHEELRAAVDREWNSARCFLGPDEDPEATYECLQECKQLARDLRLELRMLATLQEQLASVAFDDHQPIPEFDMGGEG